MAVILGIYAMFSLEMIVEGGYLKNLTGTTLAAVGNFFTQSVYPSVCLVCLLSASIVPR